MICMYSPNFMAVPLLDLKFFLGQYARTQHRSKMCKKYGKKRRLMAWGHIRDLENGKLVFQLTQNGAYRSCRHSRPVSPLITNISTSSCMQDLVIARRQQKVGLLFPSVSSSRHMTIVYKDIWNKTHFINHFPSQSSKRLQTEVISTFSLPSFHTTEQIL